MDAHDSGNRQHPLTDPGHHSLVSGIPDLVAFPDDRQATRAGALFVADHILGAAIG
ncbi:hypothetical protein AB0C34_01350 [Nocardia sp. NPDC049220]|uniref:hypothetical protein n=1 Tax=Nocardia sp. NPDC049220 TaxID=3155273 RepID=UPI0033E1F333